MSTFDELKDKFQALDGVDISGPLDEQHLAAVRSMLRISDQTFDFLAIGAHLLSLLSFVRRVDQLSRVRALDEDSFLQFWIDNVLAPIAVLTNVLSSNALIISNGVPFECECGHIIDVDVESYPARIECAECGEQMIFFGFTGEENE